MDTLTDATWNPSIDRFLPARAQAAPDHETLVSMIEHVSAGGTLTKWIAMHKQHPMAPYRWAGMFPAFRTAWIEARRCGNERLIDQVLDIADGKGDKARGVKINTRLRLLALLDPRFAANSASAVTSQVQTLNIITGVPPRSIEHIEVARATVDRSVLE